MEYQEKNIVLIGGNTYVRCNAVFMREEDRWHNLRLERTQVRVESCCVVGGEFAVENFNATLMHPFISMADVLYFHLGENDFHPTKDAVIAARELYGKIVSHLVRARRAVPFPEAATMGERAHQHGTEEAGGSGFNAHQAGL
jgi:hypothetical protein